MPSGALRVRVYAGKDPLTGKRHDLVEVIPPGPNAATLAEEARTRLLNQVDEKRHPRTSATVDQLLDRHLETLDVGRSTHRMYRRYLEKHVRPFIGRLKAGAVDAEVLDSLYAELRRCRTHCTDRKGRDHRTPRPHDCDERCRPHVCDPLSGTTIRHIHFVLHEAYEKGVRWRWVSVNPVKDASPPPPKKPDPQPPTAEQAARIVTAAPSGRRYPAAATWSAGWSGRPRRPRVARTLMVSRAPAEEPAAAHHGHAQADCAQSGGPAGLLALAAQERQGQVEALDLAAPAFGEGALVSGEQVVLELVDPALVEVFLELGHLRLGGRAVLTGRAQGAAVVEELLVVADQVLLEDGDVAAVSSPDSTVIDAGPANSYIGSDLRFWRAPKVLSPMGRAGRTT